jgi:hypothetical protein
VVELEDHGIGLAAIDARMVSEVGHQEDEPLFEQDLLPPRGCVDVAVFVREVVLAVIGGAARPAIRVSLPSLPSTLGEIIVGLLLLAARTAQHDQHDIKANRGSHRHG